MMCLEGSTSPSKRLFAPARQTLSPSPSMKSLPSPEQPYSDEAYASAPSTLSTPSAVDPNNPRKVDRSMLDNRKRRVEMNDISGSSDFGNKCDYCLSVDRDDDLGVVTVYVDKVKFKHLGTRGQIHLHYDILSGRYVPCTLQKLSEQEHIWQQGQIRKQGEQLITVGNNHYLKITDWRYFNIRWVDEESSPILAHQLHASYQCPKP